MKFVFCLSIFLAANSAFASGDIDICDQLDIEITTCKDTVCTPTDFKGHRSYNACVGACTKNLLKKPEYQECR
jgi:hypothetical protein